MPPFIGTPGVYGLTLDIAFLLSGGQPAGVQIQGLGQIGTGSLFYCHRASASPYWLSYPA